MVYLIGQPRRGQVLFLPFPDIFTLEGFFSRDKPLRRESVQKTTQSRHSSAVEQLIRNQQVIGSNPIAGSKKYKYLRSNRLEPVLEAVLTRKSPLAFPGQGALPC
jgi:hypothetical protein